MILLFLIAKHTPVFNIFIPTFYIVYYKRLLEYNLLKQLKLIMERINLRQ